MVREEPLIWDIEEEAVNEVLMELVRDVRTHDLIKERAVLEEQEEVQLMRLVVVIELEL